MDLFQDDWPSIFWCVISLLPTALHFPIAVDVLAFWCAKHEKSIQYNILFSGEGHAHAFTGAYTRHRLNTLSQTLVKTPACIRFLRWRLKYEMTIMEISFHQRPKHSSRGWGTAQSHLHWKRKSSVQQMNSNEEINLMVFLCVFGLLISWCVFQKKYNIYKYTYRSIYHAYTLWIWKRKYATLNIYDRDRLMNLIPFPG